MRNRLKLASQIMLVLVASLLGIVTNYATNVDQAPWVLRAIQQASIPAIGLLIAALVAAQVAVHRLENPAQPPAEWPHDRIPYPGLDAFKEDEAAVFFGRESQAQDLARRLQGGTDRPAERFVALVGASGSGKSSLVRAGVLPRLRTRRWSVIPVFSPGPNPIASLAEAVTVGTNSGESATALLRRLRQDPSSLASELSRLREGRFRRLLLVVDQFEEVVTLAGEQERNQFLEALRSCLAQDPAVRVLVTLRVDYLGPLLATGHAELFQHPTAIGALSRSELRKAVERPAALVGLSFDTGIVDRIVEDAGTDDALPLLAYLLQELYLAAGSGGTVTDTLYRGLGGVAGALSRHADQTVAAIGSGTTVDSVLRVLLKFVTLQDQQATRRRVPLTELTDQERRIVDAFIEARLLMSDVHTDPSSGRETYAQVTHEALFRRWAPLRQEVEARVEQLRQRAELERWAEDWEHSGHSVDYLLTGERLTLAQRWLAALRESGQDSEAATTLVEASQRRDQAFLSRISDSIGQYVLGTAEHDPERSILLSLAALSEGVPTPAARRALMTAMASSHLCLQLDGHTDTVRQIAWSPDGLRIATASRDGSARIFDARSGRSVHELAPGGAMLEGAAWAPGSDRVAVVGRDQVVRVWDPATGTRLLTGATDLGRQTAWSPDGRWIAATFRDRTVRVWNADTEDLVHELHGHSDDVWGVAWSPDSTRLATASHDQTAIVWDLATATRVATVTGHSDFVEGVAWSPDGRRLATASGDHTVRISDARTGDLQLLIRGHTDYVWNVAWSPDGRTLASASSDRTVRVVDSRNAKVLAVLKGHADTVWGVGWSPSGTQLATSSTDGTGRVWDLRPRGAERVVLDGHAGPVNQAAWSYDGSRITTASDDGTVRVWDATTGAAGGSVAEHDDRAWSVACAPGDDRLAVSFNDGVLRILDDSRNTVHEHRGPVVECLAWSPDGTRIASGDHDGLVRIWCASTGTELMSLPGHQDWISRLAWSPSGRHLASASDDRTCRVWDVAEGHQLTVLRGHDNYVDDVAWSPDESRIATVSSDWTGAVWDATTGRHIETLKGHEGRVRAVDWSPDGRHIATGSDDRTVRTWSATTFEESAVVGVHQDKVSSIAWSPDGTLLLTASFDGTARVWAAAPDHDRLEATARNRVFRTLTPEERRHHMLPLTP